MKQFLHRLLYGSSPCPDAQNWKDLYKGSADYAIDLHESFNREHNARQEAELKNSLLAKDNLRLARQLKRAQDDCRKLKEKLEQRQDKRRH